MLLVSVIVWVFEFVVLKLGIVGFFCVLVVGMKVVMVRIVSLRICKVMVSFLWCWFEFVVMGFCMISENVWFNGF